MVYVALTHRQEIARLLSELDVRLASAAIIALLISNIGAAIIFAELVRNDEAMAGESRSRLVSTFLLSQVAKYVPGRVWGAVLQSAAVGSPASLGCLVRVNVDLALMAAAVTLGSALVFLSWSKAGFWGGSALLLGTILLAFTVLLVRPSRSFYFFFKRILPVMRTRDAALNAGMAAGNQAQLGGAFGTLLFVLGYHFGWLLLVMSVLGSEIADCMRLASMLSLSYLAGLISMLPAGLGVREAFLILASSWIDMDVATVTLVAILTRFVMMAVDLMLLPLSAILHLFMPRTWRH